MLFGFITCTPCWGFYSEVVENLNTHLLDANARSSLLAALNRCQGPQGMDGTCAERLLRPMASNNPGAAQVLEIYQFILHDGLKTAKMCQTDEFMHLNQVNANCTLLMHKEAIQTRNRALGIKKYQQCLSGSMITLAYAGSLGAQLRLAELFRITGDTRAEKIWRDILEAKQEDPKFKEQYQLLIQCYR